MDTGHSHDDGACRQFAVDRRRFLSGALAAAAGATTAGMFGDTFRQVAWADTVRSAAAPANGNVLVVLSLRGGADSLSLVVPHGDPGYAQARDRTRVPAASLVAANGMFGLHPALAPLRPLWRDGRLATVVATGLPMPTRSHFQAMEAVEDAEPGSAARVGWLNRTLGLTDGGDPRATQGVALGEVVLPASMYGPDPVVSATSVDRISLSGGNPDDRTMVQSRRQALNRLWQGRSGPLAVGTQAALSATRLLADTVQTPYRPAHDARYPDSSLGAALKDTARLIKSRIGVRAVTLDHGSWDMHANMGVLADHTGSLYGMADDLARSLAGFFTDLGAVADRVTLVTLTEFGRRVHENGSGGADHGWASFMFVAGAGVNGGRYVGTWPGLGAGTLVDGDLPVTTEYRDVLAEVLDRRFGVSIGSVFPGYTPTRVGVMAGA